MNSSENGYFDTRYVPDPHRDRVWAHICRYLERWIPPEADVLELGAGYCSFVNQVRCRTRTALDIHPEYRAYAAHGVRCLIGSCTDLGAIDDGSVDIVFASNLLEHLERKEVDLCIEEVRRVLRVGGRLLLVQPNFRLCAGRYFDDFTHVTIFTDVSLADRLASLGLRVDRVEPRFLPLSLKSRLSSGHRLVPLYLHLPFRPLAGQMLVVAEKAP